ncbi:MAG: AGE family epimerase/isomerase [Gammaproteobacteria bacterium]
MGRFLRRAWCRAAVVAVDPFAGAHERLQRWLLEHAYEVWWSRGADRLRGGYHERLRLDASPTDEPRRTRVQVRQIFAYSRASGLGWRGPAVTAVNHGLEFFLSRYARADHLFRALVAPDGAPLDERAVLYDQAFALLGLASAFEVLGEARLRKTARGLHDHLRAQLAHAGGGFEESAPRSGPLSANSHMHLLEASLAWIELDEDPRWMTLAAEIVELALTRWIDPRSGALREFFGADWQPTSGSLGRIVEPGHQFEWAWLLLRYGARAKDARLAAAALRLIEIGETHGVDPARGVAMNALLDDMSVLDGEARLWPQTERIKAACIAAEVTGEARYSRTASQATETLMRYLDVPVLGLWRDRMNLVGHFIEEPVRASSFYHIVGAVAELGRLARLSYKTNK